MTDQRFRVPAAEGSPASSGVEGQDWLRQLDWRQFEELVGAAYRLQGYTVLPTSPGADGGIDLILNRGDERIFVQCKHWKAWQVGAPVIRELFGLVVANRATRGIVVTSGTFSREAVEFARQTGTELLDGPAVLALVATGNAYNPLGQPPPAPHAQEFTSPTSTSFPPPSGPPAGVPSCPVCLSPMVLHKARRGAHAGSLFWGCSRYPGCRGTREAAAGTQRPPSPRQLTRQRRNKRTLVVALVVMMPALFIIVLIEAILVGGAFRTITTAPVQFVPTPALPGRSSPPPSTVNGMGEQPMGITVDHAGKRAYTANYVSGDVSVIETASMTVVDTIDVPGKPRGITVAGSTLYVADYSGRKVYAVDIKTHHVVSSFKAGRGTADVAVDPGTHRLFVLNADAQSIWAYDLRTHRRVGTLNSLGADSIAVDTSEHKLYSMASLGVLWAYRTTNLTRVDETYVGLPGAVAVDSKRQRLYIVNRHGLTERNLLTGKSRSIDVEPGGQSIAVDVSARRAYIANPDTNVVQAVSLK